MQRSYTQKNAHSLKFQCVKIMARRRRQQQQQKKIYNFVIFHINVHLINFRIAHTPKILPRRHDIIVKKKSYFNLYRLLF